MAITLRDATVEDGALIHRFICELASYEHEPNAVETTPDELAAQLRSEHPPFECLIAEVDGMPAGFALFFHNYSTWKGRRGIHLEDLFVLPEFRGKGVGRLLFVRVGQIANQRGCARYEWAALDWNKLAIDFYASFGAKALDEWTTFRLAGGELRALGNPTQ